MQPVLECRYSAGLDISTPRADARHLSAGGRRSAAEEHVRVACQRVCQPLFPRVCRHHPGQVPKQQHAQADKQRRRQEAQPAAQQVHKRCVRRACAARQRLANVCQQLAAEPRRTTARACIRQAAPAAAACCACCSPCLWVDTERQAEQLRPAHEQAAPGGAKCPGGIACVQRARHAGGVADQRQQHRAQRQPRQAGQV